MTDPRARGVSLWLMPEGDPRERLATLIARLAARLGTQPFAPHVTLLAGVEGPEAGVVPAVARLAAAMHPLRLRLAVVEGRDEHFRCLLARVTAEEPLRSAHALAARAFGREPDPGFLPHLSLVYGTLAPRLKASLAVELAAEAAVSFEANALHVWRTEGPVGDWREIGAFRLAAS
jgi:2'-5' RNA ligase